MNCAKNVESILLHCSILQQRLTALVVLLLLLSACSSQPTGRYSIVQDTAPDFDYGHINYQTVTPSYEPYNVWTSRPYEVLGNYYTPMLTGKGYEELGEASWYGQKFHGHKTANGEIFDMFALTAAHKTLPLPSFVKVTNLDNNKSITVRVNDRGPFHGDRIIDLSYGAAKKLAYHKHGVARVKLEVIHVSELGDLTVGTQPTIYVNPEPQTLLASQSADAPHPNSMNSATSLPEPKIANEPTTLKNDIFVQVMAIQNADKAQDLATGLANLLQVQTILPKVENIYRLQLGPISTEQKAQKLIQELSKLGFDQAFTIEVSPQ